MATTSIEWTDKVWNPCTGCNKISAGCKNCYAEGIANRFWGERKFTDVQCHEDRLEQPLHWKKPAMIFVNSMSDLFHEKVPFEFIQKVFDTMLTDLIPKRGRTFDNCEMTEDDFKDVAKHTFQILTKRPERVLRFIDWISKNENDNEQPARLMIERCGYVIPDNIWLGVSVEDQKTADERIPLLLQTPAAVRFLSIEPMLESIDLEREWGAYQRGNNTPLRKMWLHGINWVIIGVESGFNRRPCKIEWIENIVEQCKNANVPVFVKQININGKVIKDINLFPEHLKIQQYPKI